MLSCHRGYRAFLKWFSPMSDTVTVHQSIDTCYHADSVECCPIQNFEDIVLCGTYQLKEQSQQHASDQERVGRLLSYKLEEPGGTKQLQPLQQEAMDGILDIKWASERVQDRILFALVNSVGKVEVYSLTETDRQFVKMTSANLTPNALGLSLDWNNFNHSRHNVRITSSDSAGHVHVHQFDESYLKPVISWKAHEYEAWITAFDKWNTEIIYTGGDDCRLKGWDLRMDPTTSLLNSKRHSMGVCSIQSNPVKQNILATGSYDETLLVWDTRSMKQPLSEVSLGGGIWRIKWEPNTASHILTATMYNGFHVIDSTDVQDLKVVHNYKEHNSIGYGIDWCGKTKTDSEEKTDTLTNTHTIASCSFYDHLLTLWSYSVN